MMETLLNQNVFRPSPALLIWRYHATFELHLFWNDMKPGWLDKGLERCNPLDEGRAKNVYRRN